MLLGGTILGDTGRLEGQSRACREAASERALERDTATRALAIVGIETLAEGAEL